MRHRTNLRKVAIALAAGCLLGTFAATSAVAEELPTSADDYDPVITVDQTEFVAGDWGDGFNVTGSGFIPERRGIILYGRITPDTSFASAEEFETDEDGNFTVHVDPWGDPTTADSPDQAPFVVQARQPGFGFFVNSDWVRLTIAAPVQTEAPTDPTLPPADTPPAEGTPAGASPNGAVAVPAAYAGEQLAETGVDSTMGFGALALIAAGFTLVLRRRTVRTSR